MHAKPSNLPPDDLRRIDLEAAEWLVKRDRGFTAAEQDAYFQWLAADPRHGEWLARHGETWRELNALAQWRPEHSQEPNPDLLAPTRPRRRWRSRVVWFWSGALAAAAAGVALTFMLESSPPPGAVKPGTAPVEVAARTYERRVLDDGSVVELNRGALVAVDYQANLRRVRLLQGEALFTVAKDSRRPFVVHAAGVDVRAVGTAFNVRLDADNVEVLVTRGRVQVETAAIVASSAGQGAPVPIPVLEAGDAVTVSRSLAAVAPQVNRVSEDEMTRRLAWQPRMLDFRSTPLAEVVAEFGRHGGPRIVIADAELESLPIVMSFRSDNAEAFVRLLEMTAGVKAEREGDLIVLHRAR